MTVMYYEEDADLSILAGKTAAIIGYGSLGRPIAHNLNDSDIAIVVGGTGEEQSHAQADGLPNAGIGEAVQRADVILLALPDETMTQVYMESISPHLARGHTLIFHSAYNVAFGFVEPPPFVDVGLVAPRSIGDTLRENYTTERGSVSYVAVWQDASRHAWDTVLAVACAMGTLRAGAVEVSVEQEAELSLFIQQAILPAFHHIITRAADVLMEQGYPTEAVLIDLYLSGKFTDYMREAARAGMMRALQLTTMTGQYGAFSRLDRFNDLKLERLMELTMEDIRSGKFAQEWAQEYADGAPRLRRLLRHQESKDLWELEQQTLDMMNAPPFPPEDTLDNNDVR